jgi:hypothetical protein
MLLYGILRFRVGGGWSSVKLSNIFQEFYLIATILFGQIQRLIENGIQGD